MFIRFEEVDSNDVILVNTDHVAAVTIDLKNDTRLRVCLTYGGASTSTGYAYFGLVGMTEGEVQTRIDTLHDLLSGRSASSEAWTKNADTDVRLLGGTFTR